jgi:hypothetical protein
MKLSRKYGSIWFDLGEQVKTEEEQTIRKAGRRMSDE